MPRPPSDSVQIAIRVPSSWLPQAEQLAKLISRPGFEASKTDAFRAAMARGFEVMIAELGSASAGKSAPRAKRKP